MAFTPTTWVDGTTAITATQLNRIETGIDDAHAGNIDVVFDAGELGVIAGGTFAFLPNGKWYVTGEPGGNSIIAQVNINSVWRQVETVDDATAVMLISDGSNVRLFNSGGALTEYRRRQVYP